MTANPADPYRTGPECAGSLKPCPVSVPNGHDAATCPVCRTQAPIDGGRFDVHFDPGGK